MNKLLSVKEAAEALGRNRRTVARWVKCGSIQAVQIGERWYISESVVAVILHSDVPQPATMCQNVPTNVSTG